MILIIYAALYGITMKFADLLDEHKLKLFKGSALLFGILWGIFGILLVLNDNTIANIILAMNIAFIIRGKLDYLNHQIAATIIIISFLLFAKFDSMLFLEFLLVFLIFGSIKDPIGDLLKMERGLLHFLFEYAMIYYPASALIYSFIFGEWSVFYVFTTYTIFYSITKYLGAKYGYS